MGAATQVNFRIPTDLKEWLEAQKEKNRRSLTAEIVIAVMERKERVEQKEAA